MDTSAWVDAVANQIKNTLGIDASGVPYPTSPSSRAEINDRTIQVGVPYRVGRSTTRVLYNFLGPLYGTGAGSNDGDYSNADFDAS